MLHLQEDARCDVLPPHLIAPYLEEDLAVILLQTEASSVSLQGYRFLCANGLLRKTSKFHPLPKIVQMLTRGRQRPVQKLGGIVTLNEYYYSLSWCSH
jgi:hypothetical protein